jgi:hypothetical protein
MDENRDNTIIASSGIATIVTLEDNAFSIPLFRPPLAS